MTRALTLSPQKNYLIEKLVGKKINISNKIMTSKKDKSKSFQNKNFIKLIDLLGKAINFNFKIYKIDDSKLEEMSLNNHPKWDSLAHVKLLSVIEKKFKVTINETNIDKFSNIKSALYFELAFIPPTFAAARITTSGLFFLNQFSTLEKLSKSSSSLFGQSKLK